MRLSDLRALVLGIAQAIIASLGSNNLCDIHRSEESHQAASWVWSRFSENAPNAKGSYMLLSQAVDVAAAALVW